MFGNSLRDRRLQLLAQPMPRDWSTYLERHVVQYAFLPHRDQGKLRDLARVFAAEKVWVGCNGLAITDEIKITIAATACLLLLGTEGDYCFDEVRSILVYPTAYEHPPQMQSGVSHRPIVYGEAWYRGPIVLSWEQVLKRSEDFPPGRNLVLHEFAHHLDGLDGDVDGVPPLEGRQQHLRWHEVADREYARLQQQSRRGQETLLDEYGATNRVEFFAVATECFFEQAAALRQECPELYAILKQCYRQDPASWYAGVPAPASTPEEHAPAVYTAALNDSIRAMRLQPGSADALFARGVLHWNARQHELAIEDFSEAIRLHPADGEAFQHRAMALVELQRFAEALADAQQALAIDAEDLSAYRVRGQAHLGLREYAAAGADFQRLIDEDVRDARAFLGRGRARAGQGEWRSAVADFTRALRNDPALAEAYLARADAHQQLGQQAEAQVDRDEAHRRDPTLGG